MKLGIYMPITRISSMRWMTIDYMTSYTISRPWHIQCRRLSHVMFLFLVANKLLSTSLWGLVCGCVTHDQFGIELTV